MKTPGKRAQAPLWRDGELLIRFRRNSTEAEIAALLQEQGAQRVARLRGQSGIERLRLSAGSDPSAVAEAFRSSRLVEMVEPNYLITGDQMVPNDPRFGEQWALKSVSANGRDSGSDINVARAWEVTTGTRRTVIAIIDSGIDFTHTDLRQNEWNNLSERADGRASDDDGNGFTDDLHGWDFLTDTNEIRDEQGHGTAVAGIIAARGNNGTGISGVMWRASLMSLRVLDKTGTGDVASAVEAIDYATQSGAQVINCSWGTDEASEALREAISRAARRGVLVVASAGNQARDLWTAPRYPASFDLPNLLSVASTDDSDALARWSNRGAAHVSVAAPGTDILTTRMGGDYQTVSGTSASAPLVTGVAGLVKTLRPWLDAGRTRELILRGARQVPSLSDKVAAKGVVNAAGALEAVSALAPNEGLEERNGNNGGEHGNNGSGGNNEAGNRPGFGFTNSDTHRDGHEFRVTPPARTNGAPGAGLPNLDELRRRQPRNPQPPASIPSTRCSHLDPECTSNKHQAASQTRTELLAWSSGLPAIDSLISIARGDIPDSPFSLYAGAAGKREANPATDSLALFVPTLLLPQAGGNSATFVKTDATTQGSWKGRYGADGYHIINDTASYPSYAQVNASGNLLATWAASTTDARALEKAASSADRIAACWYQSSHFTIDVNITDGRTHQVALYALDWDGGNQRAQTIEILDGATNIVLDSRNVTSFSGGQYLVWNVSGHVRLKVMRTGIWNSVASGLFFDPARTNVALASNGGVATLSSQYNYSFPASAAINGDRYHLYQPDGRFNMAHSAAGAPKPDWLQVDFQGSKTIDEIAVVTMQDDYNNPAVPTETTTFTQYGLTNFQAQYWNGANWTAVPGGSVTGNNKVWRKFTFSPISTNKVRVLVTATADGYSRVMELEAWGTDASDASDFTTSRLDASNRTGTGGVDLLSRNANWSLPILGLKGRASLDLGLALSYNTLVWTKDASSSSIKFDADRGFPAPGFRLGFPVIQGRYYNSQVGANAFLLITPAGGRVELRQTGALNTYESADSSYLQLLDNGNGNLTLRPADGSQLSYILLNGQYQCAEIKDRNGNYISVSYYSDGRINTITDTLARVITFNYDAYQNLNSITQVWTVNGQAVTHAWATFGWSNLNLNTSFSGLTVIGPQNNSVIPVLTQVALADGTRYNFDYTSWGQVSKIRHYAEDNHLLSYTGYNLPGSEWLATSAQTDCPRFTERRDWAENWNVQNGVAVAAITSYSFEPGVWGQMTSPDGTIYKEFFATTGWQTGLTTATEFWSGGVKKKWSTAAYTQDDANLNYQKNPRITETNVYDSDNNRKRTTIEYGSYAQWGLPYLVKEYAADGTTPIRHTFTDYNLNADYVNRRIIGLVSAVHMSDGAWQVKTGYEYDGGVDQLQATAAPATQHDPSYNTSLTARGNLTLVSRYDVTDIANESKKLIARMGYDTNGSLIFTRDHLGHQTNLSYTDSFKDNINRNTFAYPTVVTPPLEDGENAESFSSTSQYSYDLGALTRTKGPAPAGQAQGAIQTFEYDGVGRVSRVNNVNNGAYRRFVYDPAGAVKTFSTIQTGAPEAYSVTVYDGMGRVRATGGDNPNSAGGYRGQYIEYDLMGRVFRQSNPSEMTGSWATAGDDAAAGWVWTTQAYDWKGRPTVTISADGTTKEAIYGGCGCAGGEAVTIRDEVGRRKRITADILGRAWKTEVLNWDQTVYSTTINTYNARDQISNVKRYQGTEASGIFQESVTTYDGYGRLLTSRAPEQTNPTSYSYNQDDTTNIVTDARGATMLFSYNKRHQVTNIAYSAPMGVAATAPVHFTYDAAGNRTGMTDGMGSVTYQYDQLSRLTSEARQFTGLQGSYTLTYGYNLANQLTNITDPTGAQISYAYDHTGRLSDVTSAGFGSVTRYASNMRYRAWGGLKHLSFGDNNQHAVSLNYTPGMRVSRYQIDYTVALTATHRVDYQYQADGRLSYSSEMEDDQQDRSYSYDHVGRLTQALTGAEARYEGAVDSSTIPFRQNYQYDAWDNMTSRTGQHWGHEATPHTATYVNNRNTSAQWQYDASGNLRQQGMTQGTRQYSYDAVGRQVSMSEAARRPNEAALTMTQSYDGDGRRVKHMQSRGAFNVATYELRSSVLGGRVVTELNAQGQKAVTYAYANGTVLAKQSGSDQVTWVHSAPDGSGDWESYGGSVLGSIRTKELDPLGDDVGVENPYLMGGGGGGVGSYPSYGDPTDMTAGCVVDGFGVPCRYAYKIISWRGVGHVRVSFYHSPGAINLPVFIPTKDGVKNRLVDPTDPDDVYADWSDEAFTYSGYFIFPQETPLSPDEIREFEKNVNDVWSKSHCKVFVEAVLIKAAAQTGKPLTSANIMELFNIIKGQGGFVHGKTLLGSAEAFGSIGNGNARVIFAARSLISPTSQGKNSNGQLGIHEITHLATRMRNQIYDDRDLAVASHDVAIAQGYDLRGKTPLPKQQSDYPNYNAWVLANSNYYTGRLFDACK